VRDTGAGADDGALGMKAPNNVARTIVISVQRHFKDMSVTLRPFPFELAARGMPR
jgi:hypothetical protein